MDLLEISLLAGVALFSATLGSVAGTGGSAVLLPVLILYFGVREGVAILTIANIAANASRVLVNRAEVVWPVALWYCLASIPMALAGSYLFTVTAPTVMTRLLGAFMLFMLAWRRLPVRPPRMSAPWMFAPVGAVLGFLSGFMSSTGPLMAPFFLAFGLVKGAYIGTDALVTVLGQVVKVGVFAQAALIDGPVLLNGLLLVPFMVLGAVAGKRIMDRLPERMFMLMIEAVLLVAGLNFLLRG